MNNKGGIELVVKQIEVYITSSPLYDPHGVRLSAVAKLTLMTELLVPDFDVRPRTRFSPSYHSASKPATSNVRLLRMYSKLIQGYGKSSDDDCTTLSGESGKLLLSPTPYVGIKMWKSEIYEKAARKVHAKVVPLKK